MYRVKELLKLKKYKQEIFFKYNAFFASISIYGQSIRKDYREFTNQEMIDYRAALQNLRTSGTWNTLATAHGNHFTSQIHTTGSFTGEQFLPWHRFFLIEVEWYQRNTSSNAIYLSIPYWDWRTDNTTSANWHTSFLSTSNLTGFTFTRCLPGSSCAASGPNPYLANTTDILNTLNLTPFWNNTTSKSTTSPDFSHRLEHYHDRVHVWVGGNTGTMNTGTSPNDPIFYLHHNMIDYLWQIWEDNTTALQSSFPVTGANAMVHYGTPEYPFNVLANNMKDSRSVTNPANNTSFSRANDVWFAFNKKVILDGANGSDFVCSDVTSPYTYRYTAATTTGGSTVEGSIFVGDLQRDASDNVISDTKGGFRVESGVTANFKAGKDITYRPGFWAKSGSNVSAGIISTANGDINSEVVESREDSQPPKFNCVVYPNPTSSIFNIDGFLPKIDNVLAINIFDLRGTQIYTCKEILPFGAFSKNIELGNDLKSGVYILQIIENGNVYSQKIVKIE